MQPWVGIKLAFPALRFPTPGSSHSQQNRSGFWALLTNEAHLFTAIYGGIYHAKAGLLV